MSPITTHVLDTALGTPAAGVRVTLVDDREQLVAERVTDADGRVRDFLTVDDVRVGGYTLTFETGAFFEATERPVFYPKVVIHFHVGELAAHYHVPLLLSPYGYSTYRGS